jgi:hypothetical protein
MSRLSKRVWLPQRRGSVLRPLPVLVRTCFWGIGCSIRCCRFLYVLFVSRVCSASLVGCLVRSVALALRGRAIFREIFSWDRRVDLVESRRLNRCLSPMRRSSRPSHFNGTIITYLEFNDLAAFFVFINHLLTSSGGSFINVTSNYTLVRVILLFLLDPIYWDRSI